MNDKKTYILDDSSIAGILQLLQAALITNTDITDMLRMSAFEVVDDRLFITSETLTRVEEYANELYKRLSSENVIDPFEV